MPGGGTEWVQLNGATVVAVTAVLASLTGAIAWLTKALLAAKDDQAKALTEERDFYRGVAYRVLDDAEGLAAHTEEVTRRLRPPGVPGAPGAPGAPGSRPGRKPGAGR